MKLTLPPPVDLGLPAKFQSWRPNQVDAILTLDETPHSVSGICAPTGFGKTSMYMGHSALMDERICVVTSTRILQDQAGGDFSENGFAVDMRGQANYQCSKMPCTVAEGPCHVGMSCELKIGGCPYYDARSRAKTARRVITNYQYFLHAMNERSPDDTIGTFDRVVFDEGHNAFAELGKFLSVRIGSWEIANLMNGSNPTEATWLGWAQAHHRRLRHELERLQEAGAHTQDSSRARAHRIRTLSNKLTRLSESDPKNWLMQASRGSYSWECIWPGDHAKKMLLKGAPKFLFTSATLIPKTFDLLGLKADEYQFTEYPSSFPVDRRPIYYYPVVRVTAKSSSEELLYWMHAMDRFEEMRSGRKGIVQTVSYARAEMMRANSKHPQWFILNKDADGLPVKLKEYRDAAAPRILASPSITEGVDFPGRECEYVIVSKVPFPPPNPLDDARKARDPEYIPYTIMQDIVQGAGRGMRFAEDRCETLIPDGMFGWFWRDNKEFAPGYFNEAVQEISGLPKPAPKL